MIKVTQLQDVNTTRYREGELLIDRDNKAGVIIAGVVKELNFDKPLTKTQINNMIKKEVKNAVDKEVSGE
ncbi:MAG TPA: hypothetical protein VK121_07545 [Pseudogracilibacillus sp.]|nr:hypothetical protein [Pseudogracilibacillus sp.]